MPVTIPVTITNNGPAPEQYFVDARLNSTGNMTLSTLSPPADPTVGYALPLGSTTDLATPVWLVPTQIGRVQFLASATLPVEFDFSPFPGDPDLFAPPLAHQQAIGTYAPAGSDVSPGVWSANPTELGPYSGPAPPGFVQMNLVATGNAFDPAVTSATGDLWLAALDPTTLGSFAPITVNPHQSAVIEVTITPSGSSGQVVERQPVHRRRGWRLAAVRPALPVTSWPRFRTAIPSSNALSRGLSMPPALRCRPWKLSGGPR